MGSVTFNIGDRVISIENNEIRKGVVVNKYDVNPPVLLVDFGDGKFEKVLCSKVALDTTTESDVNVPEESKPEPVEKSEITITPDEFREIALKVVAEKTIEHNPMLGIAFTLFCSDLHKALFCDEGPNA